MRPTLHSPLARTYSGIGYANPHAPTQIAEGHSTSTFSYDNAGNLIQKTTDGVTTTYPWDYANRLIALGSGGATTTYGYDAFGSRVFQATATTTTLYCGIRRKADRIPTEGGQQSDDCGHLLIAS